MDFSCYFLAVKVAARVKAFVFLTQCSIRVKEDFKSRTKLLLSEQNHNSAEDIEENNKDTIVTPLYQMKIKFKEFKVFKPSHYSIFKRKLDGIYKGKRFWYFSGFFLTHSQQMKHMHTHEQSKK